MIQLAINGAGGPSPADIEMRRKAQVQLNALVAGFGDTPVTTETGGLDLEAIRARADAATDGPWEVSRGEDYRDGLPTRYVRFGPNSDSTVIDRDEDAAFIAAARTDVGALLAEVERLRQRVDPSLISELGAQRMHEELIELRAQRQAVLDLCDESDDASSVMLLRRSIRAALGADRDH